MVIKFMSCALLSGFRPLRGNLLLNQSVKIGDAELKRKLLSRQWIERRRQARKIDTDLGITNIACIGRNRSKASGHWPNKVVQTTKRLSVGGRTAD